MRTRKLDPVEIRVLGALMEKEHTTPDQYPLTINGVLAACNQKSNRNPVTDLTETEVVQALDRLRQDALAWRKEGARAERWEHCLDRRWQLRGPSKAVMCLLLLRGAQTPGELKTRCDRLYRFESRDQVEEVLHGLGEGFDAMVEELPRRPGQRENRWMHKVCAEEHLDALNAAFTETREPEASSGERSGPLSDEGLEYLEAIDRRLRDLEEEVRSLRIRLGDLDESPEPE